MLYVDDLQISCQGSDMRLTERQLQTTVNRLVKCCDQNGHTISPSKSSCVHFCRKRNLHPDPSIHIGNIQIPVVSEVRFLGIIFDSKLTFLPHVLYLRKKCERSLNILKVLSNTPYGERIVSLLRVYQSLILLRLDYGCVVYGSARASVLRRLDAIHHSALRICCGAFRKSPVQSLYVTCNQLPLNLRRKKQALAYYFKILSVRSHSLRSGNLTISMRRIYNARSYNIRPFMERTKLLLTELDLPVDIHQRNFLQFQPWNTPCFRYINPYATYSKSAIAPVAFQRIFACHRSRYSDYSPIYTDGSKRADYVGCGIVMEDNMRGYRLENCCSISTAEAIALYRALQLIDPKTPRKYCIYTDSMSVLEAIENYNDRCHPVVDDTKKCNDYGVIEEVEYSDSLAFEASAVSVEWQEEDVWRIAGVVFVTWPWLKIPDTLRAVFQGCVID
ncbi:putative RNA-directed DNA polymerase from transposon BS [Trichonephila clavipes]|nr:putative RNA-directed DNA polymerase from transposon BS [Trichonephila clavipes]